MNEIQEIAKMVYLQTGSITLACFFIMFVFLLLGVGIIGILGVIGWYSITDVRKMRTEEENKKIAEGCFRDLNYEKWWFRVFIICLFLLVVSAICLESK